MKNLIPACQTRWTTLHFHQKQIKFVRRFVRILLKIESLKGFTGLKGLNRLISISLSLTFGSFRVSQTFRRFPFTLKSSLASGCIWNESSLWLSFTVNVWNQNLSEIWAFVTFVRLKSEQKCLDFRHLKVWISESKHASENWTVWKLNSPWLAEIYSNAPKTERSVFERLDRSVCTFSFGC